MRPERMRLSVSSGLALACLALQTTAGTFELNCARGLWQFNGDLQSRWACQSDAVALGFTIDGEPGSAFRTGGRTSWLELRSDSWPHRGLASSESLIFPHAAAPNGPPDAVGVNNWTVMMDVRIPTNAGCVALLRHTWIAGSSDIFINLNRQVVFSAANGPSGPSPVASDPIPTNEWVRLAFSSRYVAATGRIVLRAYVDGAATSQSASGQLWANPEEDYALNASGFSLFSESYGNTGPVDVNSVALWASALSAYDIADLGASDGGGIVWPGMTVPDGWPPLPPLNGKLMFGSFETHYTPDMAAVAATAMEPFYSEAVADVVIDLGVDGGRIPGMPDHVFGTSIDAFVLPDGTAVAFGSARVQHVPAQADDVATLGGVTLVRTRNIWLTPEGAKGDFDVYLPAGFGVGIAAADARLRDRASVTNEPLGAALQPTNEVVALTGKMFGVNANAMLHPVLDRVPVRFTTSSLAWHTQSGLFRFEQDFMAPAAFTRIPQLVRVAAQQAAGLPGAAIVPPSNDGYFIAAGVPGGEPIVVEARPEGAALIRHLALSLDATALGGNFTGFATHYPILSVRWTGTDSQIRFVDDAIDLSSSRLFGVLPSLTSYRRAVLPSTDGAPDPASAVPDEPVYFSSGEEGMWFFTPDGGLYAWGKLSSTPEFEGQSLTPEWGGFRDTNGVVKFTHAVTTNALGEGGFPYGDLLTAGTAVRNDDPLVEALPEAQRVASILLTGHRSPVDEQRIERPGTAAYLDGLANYPGVNLRGMEYPTPHTARSVIAGAEVKPDGYELAPEAKYCIRPGGVSGVHIASTNSGPVTFEAYSSEFALTRLILSYRDGANVDSGVGGGLHVAEPASFDLIFERLCLGPQGELEHAGIAPGQKPTVGPLGAWNLKCAPLALDFPQRAGDPKPMPDEGFIRVGVAAALPGLGEAIFTGNLGFFDGNIVADTLPARDGIPIAFGIENLSRFATESALEIAGTPQTGGESWRVNPVTGIAVNRWVDDSSQGTLTVGGLLDLPFFVDMPVVLSTGSKNTQAQGEAVPSLYVRQPWASLEAVPYDPDHLGHPAALALADYRLFADYDPVATRDWQDLIGFALPVKMDADRVIRSREPLPGQALMLFNLTETVRSMTPQSAEITMDGRDTELMDELTRQVNVAALLGDSTLPGADPAMQAAIDGALDCVRNLDRALADHSHPLLDSGLARLAAQEATPKFFQYLKEAPDAVERRNRLDNLAGDDQGGLVYAVLQMFSPDDQDPNRLLYGQWRRDIEQTVADARKGLDAAAILVDGIDPVVALAQSLALRMNLPDSAIGEPDEARQQAAALLLEQAALRLQPVDEALAPDGKLTTALRVAQEGTNAVTPIVRKALDDLKPKWAPADPAQSYARFNAPGAQEAFAQDLAAALADRVAESNFGAACGALMRLYLADPQTMTRQALDDTLGMACSLVADAAQGGDTLNANGSLHDYLLADNLRGYARIVGDSLHELRLDGTLTLQAHEDLPRQRFEAWCLMRDVDSSTPGSDAIPEGDVKAEIEAGATTQIAWGGQSTAMTLGAKIGLGAGGSPVSFMGDMALVGAIDLSAIEINNLKLGIGMGPDDAYFYGRAGGKIAAMPVAAGAFFGKTSDVEILKNADRDIAGTLAQMQPATPLTGALVYGEGQVSLMPLIGIPPSCLLDLRLGGGQGYFVFVNGNDVIGGFKLVQSVSGELLCICDVTGRFASVLAGSGTFNDSTLFSLNSLNGRAWATVEGEIGCDPFSYTFEKSIGITLKLNSGGGLSWDVDY